MDVLAEITRSGLVEGRHYGAVVRIDATGQATWSLGDCEAAIFPRSCNKPIQTMGMLQAGLSLRGRLLALATSSHSGSPMHLAGVREILALGGLDETALQTPPSYPLDPHTHADYIRAGGERSPIAMDCSGKHAAMLLLCVENGWDTATYLDPAHPVQQAIAEAFVDLTGAPPMAVGTDGCGAPLLGTSLLRLARAVSAIACGQTGSLEAALRDAMVSWPEYVSGDTRDECHLMRAFPGALAKSGAEAVYVVAMADGTAFALKIADGSDRARPVVMARMMQLAGYAHPLLDVIPDVLGGGEPVGVLQAAF